MKNNAIILTFFVFCTGLGFSQNMEEGFSYLETGKYEAAELFFNSILTEYPKNKTARLCYGRAVGLNGDAKQAVVIFTALLKEYPKDFEMKLNYAEALLWNKNFIKAKPYYKALIQENNQSFPALLGYANTLSNLKMYSEALGNVNKALAVSPGNANALISKKYVHLGFANQYIQSLEYDKALVLLNQNLTIFKADKETLLNIANVYLITDSLDLAKATYLNLAKRDSITALNGLSLVSHLKGREKQALKISVKAVSKIVKTKDSTIIEQTQERFVQALIWNKKYKEAEVLINELLIKYPNKNWVLSLLATLNIYKSRFKESIVNYDAILKNDSLSFDGNLGKANALKASGLFNEAYARVDNTLNIFENQKDATHFLNTLNTQFTPFLETKIAYSFDNGDNKAVSWETSIDYPLSTKLKLLGRYGYRNTRNSVTNNHAESHNEMFGVAYQLYPNITFKSYLGIMSAKATTNSYTQLLVDISFNIKAFRLQVLDIGYKRELQNFNAELLNREIVQNNFYVNYNLNTTFNLGWFTQYYFTAQNDDNNRNLLFTSLYYNILTKPLLKAGVNYQNIRFKNQVPTIYFSPKKFNTTEVFVDLIKEEVITKSKAWFYQLTAATGIQHIEDNNSQSTYRFQGKLGYKFSDRTLVNFYGTHSNIASATAAGFRFTEIGFRFKWYLRKKPVFRKQAVVMEGLEQ